MRIIKRIGQWVYFFSYHWYMLWRGRRISKGDPVLQGLYTQKFFEAVANVWRAVRDGNGHIFAPGRWEL